MTRINKIYALLEQNYKTTKIPDPACTYNTDSYTPPPFIIKIISKLFKYLGLCTLLA